MGRRCFDLCRGRQGPNVLLFLRTTIRSVAVAIDHPMWVIYNPTPRALSPSFLNATEYDGAQRSRRRQRFNHSQRANIPWLSNSRCHSRWIQRMATALESCAYAPTPRQLRPRHPSNSSSKSMDVPPRWIVCPVSARQKRVRPPTSRP